MKGMIKGFKRYIANHSLKYHYLFIFYRNGKGLPTILLARSASQRVSVCPPKEDLAPDINQKYFSRLESTDPEFEDYKRHFASMETATEKFLKDTKAFVEAVISCVH